MNCESKLAGFKDVTSNFLKHLRKKHEEKYREYLKKKTTWRFSKKVKPPQEIFDEDVIRFLADNYLPIAIVDKPSFKNLFEYSTITVKSKKSYGKILKEKATYMTDILKEKLERAAYYCTTADLWSGNKRSFFGYTIHWM